MTRPDLALAAIVKIVRATRLRVEAEQRLAEDAESDRDAELARAGRASLKAARDPRRFRPWRPPGRYA